MYTGQFYNGDMYGNGVITTTTYTYRGMVKNGFFDGYGKYENHETLEIYEGNFKEGMKQGLGRQYRIKKDFYMSEYEGFWTSDKKQGHGKYIEQEKQDSLIVYVEGIWQDKNQDGAFQR